MSATLKRGEIDKQLTKRYFYLVYQQRMCQLSDKEVHGAKMQSVSLSLSRSLVTHVNCVNSITNICSHEIISLNCVVIGKMSCLTSDLEHSESACTCTAYTV